MRKQQQQPAVAFANLFTEGRHVEGDLVLLRRAVKQRWICSISHAEATYEAIGRAFAMIDAMPDSGVKARATLGLGEALLTMDRQNLDVYEEILKNFPRRDHPELPCRL